MSFRRILALPGEAATAGAVLDCANAFSLRFDGRIDVVLAEADIRNSLALAADGMGAAVIEEIVETAERVTAETRTAVEHVVAERRVAFGLGTEPVAPAHRALSFIALTDDPAGRRLLALARLSDLIVTAQPHLEGTMAITPSGFDVASLLLEAGRPVLVAPAAGAPPALNRIAFAWNGSKEAAHALSVALPLFFQAEQIIPFIAAKTEAADLLAYLDLYGVRHTPPVTIEAGAADAGAALLSAAQQQGADLLVMGAYGRSRLREMILGGATLDVLRHTRLPILMMH